MANACGRPNVVECPNQAFSRLTASADKAFEAVHAEHGLVYPVKMYGIGPSEVWQLGDVRAVSSVVDAEDMWIVEAVVVEVLEAFADELQALEQAFPACQKSDFVSRFLQRFGKSSGGDGGTAGVKRGIDNENLHDGKCGERTLVDGERCKRGWGLWVSGIFTYDGPHLFKDIVQPLFCFGLQHGYARFAEVRDSLEKR